MSTAARHFANSSASASATAGGHHYCGLFPATVVECVLLNLTLPAGLRGVRNSGVRACRGCWYRIAPRPLPRFGGPEGAVRRPCRTRVRGCCCCAVTRGLLLLDCVAVSGPVGRRSPVAGGYGRRRRRSWRTWGCWSGGGYWRRRWIHQKARRTRTTGSSIGFCCCRSSLDVHVLADRNKSCRPLGLLSSFT